MAETVLIAPDKIDPAIDASARKEYDRAALLNLQISIRTLGLLIALLVAPKPPGGTTTHRIVSGRRRYFAWLAEFGNRPIPCQIVDAPAEGFDLRDWHTNACAEAVTDNDLRAALRKLRAADPGITQRELAEKLAIDPSRIAKLDVIDSRLDPALLADVKGVSSRALYLIATKAKTPEKQRELFDLAKKGATLKEIEAKLKTTHARARTPNITIVVGGLKLKLPTSDVEEAKALLKKASEQLKGDKP